MLSYHECAREPPSCRGLKQGIRGYHACAKKKNCRKIDRPVRQLQTKLKSVINPISLKAVKLKKKAAPKPITSKKPKVSPVITSKKPKVSPVITSKKPKATPKPTKQTIFDVPIKDLLTVVTDVFHSKQFFGKCETSNNDERLKILSVVQAPGSAIIKGLPTIAEYQKDSWAKSKAKYNITGIVKFKSDVMKIVKGADLNELLNNKGKGFLMDSRFHCLESQFKPLLDFIWAFANSKEAKQEDKYNKSEKATRKANAARWDKQKRKRYTNKRAAIAKRPTQTPAITSPAITSPPSLKSPSQTPKVKSKNPWLIHVAKVKVENPNIQYKNVLKLAKTTYTKTT
jgi:hypothetical protein